MYHRDTTHLCHKVTIKSIKIVRRLSIPFFRSSENTWKHRQSEDEKSQTDCKIVGKTKMKIDIPWVEWKTTLGIKKKYMT